MTEIHEPVQIASTFRQRTMQPVLMLWRNRQYQLDEITSYHVTRVGEEKIHHFAVLGGCRKMAFQPEIGPFGCNRSVPSRLIKPDRPWHHQPVSLERSQISDPKAHSATAPLADQNLFHLLFNPGTFEWWLDAVELS